MVQDGTKCFGVFWKENKHLCKLFLRTAPQTTYFSRQLQMKLKQCDTPFGPILKHVFFRMFSLSEILLLLAYINSWCQQYLSICGNITEKCQFFKPPFWAGNQCLFQRDWYCGGRFCSGTFVGCTTARFWCWKFTK